MLLDQHTIFLTQAEWVHFRALLLDLALPCFIDWHLGFFFFSLQDFILEHYSEDSYLYEDDIADLMDLRQVRVAVWESALLT